MCHLLYLMFRCDFDVMENLESLEKFGDLNTPTATAFKTMDKGRALHTVDTRILQGVKYGNQRKKRKPMEEFWSKMMKTRSKMVICRRNLAVSS